MGVQNNSGSAVPAITVTGPGSGLAELDGDGICTYTFTGDGYCNAQQIAGTNPADYEGPGTTIVTAASLPDSAEIDFTNGLATGASAYFSLEGALTSASITARLGHLGYNYVALGDSYSSGEGNPPFVLNGENTDTKLDQCHRSPDSYPALLSDDGTVVINSFTDRACSGATTTTLTFGNPENHEDSQLNHISSTTNLITISIGGNDADFPGVLNNCVFGVHGITFFHGSNDCKDERVPDPETGFPVKLSTAENELIAGLGQDRYCYHPTGYTLCHISLHSLYEQIAADAQSGSRIVVLLYPHLFTDQPAKNGCTVNSGYRERISARNMTWINQGVDQLDSKILDEINLAKQAGLNITAADPRGAFADTDSGVSPGGHGVCSEYPWFNALIIHTGQVSPFSFHPNAAGQIAFENVVKASI